jgi:hypothetical protein
LPAAATIQALVQSWLCRRKLSLAGTIAVKIQRYYQKFRPKLSNDLTGLKRFYAAGLWQQHKSTAAITLQAMAHSWMCRSEVQALKDEMHMTQILKKTHAVVIIMAFVWLCIIQGELS